MIAALEEKKKSPSTRSNNAASAKNTIMDVGIDHFHVIPAPLFKVDKRHGKVEHYRYVCKELVDYYRPLVRAIVNRLMVHLPSHIDPEDLFSVGLMGLMSASKRYNPSACETFKAYVKTRVRGAIFDELRRLDCLPRSARAKVRKIQDAASKLEQSLGRTPTENELRKHLNLNEKQYYRMVTRVKPLNMVSLDGAFQNTDHEMKSLHEVIADESRTPMVEGCCKRELIQLLTSRIESMPKKHRQILSMYYFEDMRISEIAKLFKITEARVCQIQSYALGRLRKYASAIM